MTTEATGDSILKRLSEPFPDEAIERTDGNLTGKGYNTTGIKYQFIVNRLNEVLGLEGWRTVEAFAMREGKTRHGQPMFDVTCEIKIQLGKYGPDGAWLLTAERSAIGGHRSRSEADARKGAYTNGLKKCAAMFGCGWEAYAGQIDDDSEPVHDTQPAQGHAVGCTALADGRTKSQPQHRPHAAAQAPRPSQPTQPPPARTQLDEPTDRVLGLILGARSMEQLIAAGVEAEKLDDRGKAAVRAPWKAKQRELTTQQGRRGNV